MPQDSPAQQFAKVVETILSVAPQDSESKEEVAAIKDAFDEWASQKPGAVQTAMQSLRAFLGGPPTGQRGGASKKPGIRQTKLRPPGAV